MSIQFNLPEKILFAHRGCSGNYPENTLLAFNKAIQSGAKAIELDIMLSKDNKFFISHEHIIKITGKTFDLKKLTLEEIKNLELPDSFKGEKIPEIDEVLSLLPEGFILNIELKLHYSENYHKYIHHLIPILTPYLGKIQFLLSSFHPLAIRAVQKWGKAPTAFILENTFLSRLTGVLINLFNWRADYITLDVDMNAHHKYMSNLNFSGVSLYTINHPEKVNSLFQEGIRGIFTDFPEKMEQVK